MKHKITKAVLSVFLSLVIVLVPLLSVTAKNKTCPTVYVSGFMSHTLYADPDDPNSDVVWPPASESIINTVKNCIPAISELALTMNWDNFTDAVIPEVDALLSPCYLNARGESDKSGVRECAPDINSLRNSNSTSFVYDWRLDPLETAAKLDSYIDEVLNITGAEKVNLVGHSYGGVITLTYSTLYGNSKINSYVFNSSAIYGITFTGELLNGRIVVDSDGLRSCLEFFLRDQEKQDTIRGIIYMLASAGLLDFVSVMANDIVKHIKHRAIYEVLTPMFGRWPCIWAMSSDEAVGSGIDYMFTNIVEDNEDSAALRAKIDSYNDIVRFHREETLSKIDKECHLGVIARYGYPGIPLTSAWNRNGDGTIDLAKASFGATVSIYEHTLPEQYIMQKNPEYISPDRSIDASTARFADRTWYIKEMEHSQSNSDLDKLINKIIYSTEEFTVYTDPEFPRFLKCDNKTNTLSPDIPEKEIPINSFWQLFERYWEAVYRFILKLKTLFR